MCPLPQETKSGLKPQRVKAECGLQDRGGGGGAPVFDGDSVSVGSNESVLDAICGDGRAASNHQGGLFNVTYILLLAPFYII